MIIKLRTFACVFSIAIATACTAGPLVIDDFSTYTSTAELQQAWGSFGKAASSGPATLEPGEGESGGNAALFQLNWDAGNNANMRLTTLPADKQDLSAYTVAVVTIKLANDAQGHPQPANATALRIVVKGGPDDSIWQTDVDTMPTIEGGDTYTTITLPITDSTMVRESGKSSLIQTLTNISDIRLRFENKSATDSRQDAYIDALSLNSQE